MQSVTITCPHCGLTKDAPAEKLPKSEVQVTCPRCRQRFPLSCGRQAVPQVAAPAEPPRRPSGHQAPPGARPDKPTPARGSWGLATQYRHLLVVVAVLAALYSLSSLLLLLITPSPSQVLYLQTAITVVSGLLAIAVAVWRINTPLCQLSPNGISAKTSPFAPKGEFAWQEMVGMATRESSIFGRKQIQVTLLLGGKNSPLRELAFPLKIVERPDELLARLREQIPPLTAAALAATGRLETREQGEVRFGSYILSPDGIAAARSLIPWSAVREIRAPQFVLAGYGSVTIVHAAGSKTAKLAVAAKMAPEYQRFVAALLRLAPHAVIDPAVARILDQSPQEAKRESAALLLLVLGAVVSFAAALLALNFVPLVPLKALSSLAIAAAGFIPFLAAGFLLAARSRGGRPSEARMLGWAGAACGAPILALALLFLLFPSGRYALQGDRAFRSGDLDQAARYFELALAATPENLDASFALGMVYMEKKEYDRSFQCLQKVYLADSLNWQSYGMELIPDALLKAGRYDEALSWCDRIERDHPRRRELAEALQSKRSEIIRAKRNAGSAGSTG